MWFFDHPRGLCLEERPALVQFCLCLEKGTLGGPVATLPSHILHDIYLLSPLVPNQLEEWSIIIVPRPKQTNK